MGKATILPSGDSNLPNGQYKVRIEKDNTRVEAEAKRIDFEVEALTPAIPDRYTAYEDAQNAHNNAKSDLDAVIQQSNESPNDDYSEKLTSATTAEREAYGNLLISKSGYQAARLKQRALQGKKLYLTARVTEDIRNVWCADCQRALSGEVSTVEIPNTDADILIRPGGPDGSGSVYSASRDGQLRSVASMSPAETAWNFTMFPGWQKWNPLYRLGQITTRIPNNSKCGVLLDATSTAQSLDVDAERRLSNVPMVYKGRDDGGPYQVGDRVVVEFTGQDRSSPRVVGFERDPCTTSSTGTSSTVTTTTTEIPTKTFYIRFTFNGCIPDHSGYEIKVACGEQSLYGYTWDSSKDMVGPFTVTGCNPYASVNWRWMYYEPWTPSSYHLVGDKIKTRRAYSTRNIIHRCITAGTSGTQEPEWLFEAPPNYIEDGSAEWEFIGYDNTGFEFFWHYTITNAEDPDPNKIRRAVGIFADSYEGINNTHLHTPATGDFYVKLVPYKRHPTQVFDCYMTIETIQGIESEVYHVDFEELRHLYAAVSGMRFDPCKITDASPPEGEPSPELSPDNITLTTISEYGHWPEESGTLARISNVFPHWVPNTIWYPYAWPPPGGGPGYWVCDEWEGCGHNIVYGGHTAFGVSILRRINYPSGDINRTFCITGDEYGCDTNYPGCLIVLDDGRSGTWTKAFLTDPPADCSQLPEEYFTTGRKYDDVVELYIVMRDVPCGHFVPERFRP